MKATEALKKIILYAMNKSPCGKLPQEEYQATLELKKFLKDLKSVEEKDLIKIINEKL